MHARQPMHAAAFRSTMPSRREERARGADVHARRVRALIAQHGQEQPLRFGNEPFSTVFTQQRFTPTGMSCSALQAIVHAWQPMHFGRSMTNP
jgi:hypothetical protein